MLTWALSVYHTDMATRTFHCDILLISFTKSPYIWRDLVMKRIMRTENRLIFSWHLFSELPGFSGLRVPPSNPHLTSRTFQLSRCKSSHGGPSWHGL